MLIPHLSPVPPLQEAPDISPRSFPQWLVVLFGGLVALTWIGAVALYTAPIQALPSRLLGIMRTPVLLAIPALVLPAMFVVVSWWRPTRGHRRAFSLQVLLVLLMCLVAVPALLPYRPAAVSVALLPFDLASAPLRVPTVSLGVALALGSPFLGRRPRSVQGATDRVPGPRGPSVMLAGFAFAVTLLVADLVIETVAPTICFAGDDNMRTCDFVGTNIGPGIWPLAIECGFTGLLGTAIGYGVGWAIAQIDA